MEDRALQERRPSLETTADSAADSATCADSIDAKALDILLLKRSGTPFSPSSAQERLPTP